MKIAFIDSRTSLEEKNNLEKLNIKIICCPLSSNLYNAVCGHPDMLIHLIDDTTILVHKDIDKNFINLLTCLGFNVILSNNSLKNEYPKDIILNAVNLPNLFMHKLAYTDPQLLNLVKNKKLLNISQGYSKCSTAIVSNSAIMTSDVKIANILNNNNVDVLLLPPGDILLPGLDYGFIGGCCGLIDSNTIAFFGDLHKYKYEREVLNFLKKHNVKPVFLSNNKLIDRGSLLITEL
ncbi:hypothetical protein FDF74_11080 [Clostridium niameyense]|uniref:DUF6873 domain-containing protein n=1 Tax=Clostridium niameyense TaxID=1622073 RepID=A0A6M0RC11_9CLOT|nr:hypothetical protein [Clostridium niameyense]NEZ47722.1 hypothetical protein [Clostridium niameyense]